jgi:hypothetical protein
VCDLETSRIGAPYIYDISNLRVKLQPEDGFTKAETCSCYVLLFNYILCNEAVLD